MLKNISIKTKLWVSYGILATLIAVVSLLSIFFLTRVKEATKKIYDHPYIVSNTIKDFEINFLKLKNSISLLVLTESDETIAYYSTTIDTLEQENDVLIDVLYERYLGDSNDVKLLEDLFETSKDNRDTVFAYMNNQEYEKAQNFFYSIGPDHRGSITTQLNTIIDFAEEKGIEFVSIAEQLLSSYIVFMIILSILVIGLAVVTTTLIINDMLPPLYDMLLTIKSHQIGENKEYINQKRNDEIGLLGENLHQMLRYLKNQKEVNELTHKLENLRNKEVLRVTLLSIGDGVITTDLKEEITEINQIACELVGYNKSDVIGRKFSEIFKIQNKKSLKPVNNLVKTVLDLKKSINMAENTVLYSKNGNIYDIADSAAPIKDESDNIYGVVLVFRDITEEYKRQAEIEYLSYNDKLTGLKNRNYLEEVIDNIKVKNQNSVGLIIGDVNGLKVTNDAFGHDYGDRLMQKIANIFKDSCSKNDIIVRWGGDEFVVLIKESNLNHLEELTKKIINKCNNSNDTDLIKPNISVGFATYENSDNDLYRTLIRAENMMYQNKLVEKESFHSEIVSSLERSLFEKNYETEEHAIRVSKCATKLGRLLKLKSNEINKLELLGILHDIGKMSIDESILMKPGPLTDKEWEIIREHPATGYRIATNIKGLSHIANGILTHHERYDGKGYPKGLVGKDIPIEGRILCICDSFDVMTNDRPYRRKLSIEEAINELKSCSGTQFDPVIVDLFIKELEKSSK